MVARVLAADELIEYADAFGTVFRATDYERDPFTRGVSRRGVLYPVRLRLEGHELRALESALAQLEDGEFYLGYDEAVDPGRPLVYLLDSSTEGYDRAATWPVPHHLVSRAGRWGMGFADEDLCVVGGEEQFVRAFFEALERDPIDVAVEFYADRLAWEREVGFRNEWVEPLLAHLFGAETARTIVERGREVDLSRR